MHSPTLGAFGSPVAYIANDMLFSEVALADDAYWHISADGSILQSLLHPSSSIKFPSSHSSLPSKTPLPQTGIVVVVVEVVVVVLVVVVVVEVVVDVVVVVVVGTVVVVEVVVLVVVVVVVVGGVLVMPHSLTASVDDQDHPHVSSIMVSARKSSSKVCVDIQVVS